MVKKLGDLLPKVPYAELIIRAADSRPIVMTLTERGGDVNVSAGPKEDAVEATVILQLMLQVLKSVYNVRDMNQRYNAGTQKTSKQDDDIPF